MSATKVPIQLIRKLKEQIVSVASPGVNIHKELADLLKSSQESVYRKFRGETAFNISELYTISKHYGINLGFLLNTTDEKKVNFKPLFNLGSGIQDYLEDILTTLNILSKYDQFRLTMTCADAPLFRIFGYPNLTKFKVFYWNNILNSQQDDNEMLDMQKTIPMSSVCRLHDLFLNLNIVEVWSKNTLTGMLNQIEYYYDCGLIKDADMELLSMDMKKLIDDLFDPTDKRNSNLYLHELSFNNNTFFVETKQKSVLSLGVNGINSIMSEDKDILSEHRMWFRKVMAKSYRVSGQSKKISYALHREFDDQLNRSFVPRLTTRYLAV
ncbi:MAG: hypothetical protein H6607_02470 [Flavobacteriales bacterium]|nr:hypothetical protein [Flavobacteriales bacterium]